MMVLIFSCTKLRLLFENSGSLRGNNWAVQKPFLAVIYNALGQLVLVAGHTDNLKSVDVSGLQSGTYYLKLKTDKGNFTAKS